MPSSCRDVIVVGGGISGLHAAYCLKQKGLDVVVLEARDRVGGRTWTWRGKSANEYADMGGAYFGKQQTKILELSQELGLKIYSLPVNGKTVFSFNGKAKFFEGDYPQTSNPFNLMDLASTVRNMDWLSLQIPLEEPWSFRDAQKLDSINVDDYLKMVCWTRFARRIISTGFAAVFAVPPDKVSMLYCLHLIRSCGGAKALFSQKNGLQEMKLIGGSCSVSERLASEIGSIYVESDRVIFNSCVTEVKQLSSDGNGVVLVTENGKEYQAQVIIVATSPSTLKAVDWSPPLPQSHSCYVNLKQVGHYFKTVMYYDRAYWTDAGLKGDLLSDSGIVRVAFPDTKYDGSHPAIMGFVDGKEYEDMTSEQRKTSIANHYAELFGIDAMRNPVGYIEKHWDDESEKRFSGPCVFSLPPGFLCKYQRFWGQPFGQILFAGSESSTVFRGYIDGGIRAAERAAEQAVQMIKGVAMETEQHVTSVPYNELTVVERYVPGVNQFIAAVTVLVSAIVIAIFF